MTRSLFGCVALGGIGLWLAQPPVGFALLAWVATIPWIFVITEPQLKGRRPYLQIWMALWMYWLASLYFIPIPHPLLWVGWLFLAAYQAAISLGFFVISRQAIWRWGLSPLFVVPVVWTSIEWARAQTEYGFGMFGLGHSQFRWPIAIQLADIGGSYVVSLMLIGCATGLTIAWRGLIKRGSVETTTSPHPNGIFGLFLTAATVSITLGYGYWKLNETSQSSGPVVRKALVIQGSIDTVFPGDRDEAIAFQRNQIEEYRRITIAARQKVPEANLLLWPESIFAFPIEYESTDRSGSGEVPANLDYLRKAWFYCVRDRADLSNDPTPLPPIETITGAPVFVVDGELQYNSVVKLSTFERYDKILRVPFGEFIPVWDWFRFLDDLSPIGRGLTRGRGPMPLKLEAIRDGQLDPQTIVSILPSVCFESTVPQVIRRQLNAVEVAGEKIDWLANFTNDGWFYGTSCLDFHLACTVFRSVELRKPFVAAANTGFSAEIDHLGRILQQGPRREEGFLVVDLTQQPQRWSLYRLTGDLPWMIGAAFSLIVLISAVRDARQQRQAEK
jgi:apolipoprotein N-acyltransferase